MTYHKTHHIAGRPADDGVAGKDAGCLAQDSGVRVNYRFSVTG